MAEIIEMPKLSDTMVEGVIVAWHKQVGDALESGELLAEIETDKATMELESFYDGVLLYVQVGESGSVPVGDLLAIVGEKGEDVSGIVAEYEAKNKAAETEAIPEVEVVEEVSVPSTTAPTVASSDGRVKASPLAKAMAKERGLDLSRIQGTGPEGRIVKVDVENYKETASASSGTPLPVGVERFRDEPLSQMRKTIARRLTESKNQAPHFYLTMEIDMEKAVAARKQMNEVSPVKISFNDLIIKAAGMALRQHPGVNSSWLGNAIRIKEHVHIGMAVAIPDGLVVPVIRFADSLSLSQISGEARRLAGMARDRKLQPSDWAGNTFTISNLGMFGIEQFTAIINSPDGCILAVGGIRDVPVVKDGQVVPGKTMKVTMSCDHRVVDGAVGSAFLKTLKSYLENPVNMLV